MPFRFQSRHVFLTYPKCNKSPEEVLAFLKSIEDFNAYTISTEKHQDDTNHVHVLLEFPRKLRHSDERRWDIGINHPNVVCPRAIGATREYIKKDGKYIENGWIDKPKPYSKILSEATTKNQFLTEIRQHHTRDYVNNYDRILSMAESHFKESPKPYTPGYTSFLPCTMLDEWVSSSLVS